MGQFILDRIAFEALVVDAKVIDHIAVRGQMQNYLRITKLRVEVILNIEKPKLEWERLVRSLVSIGVHSWFLGALKDQDLTEKEPYGSICAHSQFYEIP